MLSRIFFLFFLFGLVCRAGLLSAAAEDDRAAAILEKASQASSSGRAAEAIDLASEAVKADPGSVPVRLFRANLHAALGHHESAIADYDQVVHLDPRRAEVYDQRGSQHFMLGHIAESITDFDKYISLVPDQEPHHWKRGISYYYAARYDEGRKQFEGYQTIDDNDVENAVWRYLCMARMAGIEKARASLLPIKADRRVPMMEVYALFAGRAKPADVLAAARAGNPPEDALEMRLFYAHLYLGLYAEAAGDTRGALEHMDEAASRSKKADYMGAVSRVHADLLHRRAKKN
jgi:lipoprotein NlpI